MTRLRQRLFIAMSATVLSGCAGGGLYIPDVAPEPVVQEAATTETGSRIPRGRKEAVRDSPQHVDVLTEQDLEKQKPANTREAVQRATRGF